MIVYLYGEDSYRLLQKLKVILEKYRSKHGCLNIERISAESVDWLDKFIVYLRSCSIFSAKKLVILDDLIFKNIKSADQKKLKKILELYLVSEEEIIILVSPLSLLPPAFAFLLKKPVEREKFGKLTSSSLSTFIKEEAESRGLSLNEKEIRLLSESFGVDTWSIATELDKLSLLNQSSIAAKTSKYSYYQLINLFKSHRSCRSRLIALEILLSDLKEEPAKIFNGLAYGSFFFLPHQEWYQKLADYDVYIKSGRLDYEEVLVDLAVS